MDESKAGQEKKELKDSVIEMSWCFKLIFVLWKGITMSWQHNQSTLLLMEDAAITVHIEPSQIRCFSSTETTTNTSVALVVSGKGGVIE